MKSQDLQKDQLIEYYVNELKTKQNELQIKRLIECYQQDLD